MKSRSPTTPPCRGIRTHFARFHCRGLRHDDAAAYVGVSPAKFDEWLERKFMPRPKRIDGEVLWDRFSLDQAFSLLPDGMDEASEACWRDLEV